MIIKYLLLKFNLNYFIINKYERIYYSWNITSKY